MSLRSSQWYAGNHRAEWVMSLRGCGPRGHLGIPGVANMPLPKKLLGQGVGAIVRVCDGRMSGTTYETVVLHVAPEAAVGGPLALVRDGDPITLDVGARRIDIDVPSASWPSAPRATRHLMGTPPASRMGAGSTSTTFKEPNRRRPRLPGQSQRLGGNP